MAEINIELNFEVCRSEVPYYLWQRYYVQGFRQVNGANLAIRPFLSSIFAKLEDHKMPATKTLWQKYSNLVRRMNPVYTNHVGRYNISIDSKKVTVAIDGADGGEVADPEALKWADIYFKANKWENKEYPDKVQPITSGSVLLEEKQIRFLKGLRNQQKERDLTFISRIWPGSIAHFSEGLEHNVRLFESLASIDCAKDLCAIIPGELNLKKIRPYLKRLEAAGVAWSDTLVPAEELWTRIGRAQIAFFRAGKHLAIPGRMHDLLSMGACIVFDRKPYSQWYEPLVEGKHYMGCGCGLGRDESLPPEESYANMIRVIEDLLSDEEKMKAIRVKNMEYFDNYGAPAKVAQYVVDTVGNHAL